MFLFLCEASFDLAGYACSMRRGEKQGPLLSRQRSSLPGFRAHLSSQLHCLLDSEGICFKTSFADQGMASQKLVPLAHKLAKLFPSLAPHDLYRFDSVQKLIDFWMKKAQRALAVVKNRRPTLWTFWPVECAYLREWNLQVRVWRGMLRKY